MKPLAKREEDTGRTWNWSRDNQTWRSGFTKDAHRVFVFQVKLSGWQEVSGAERLSIAAPDPCSPGLTRESG